MKWVRRRMIGTYWRGVRGEEEVKEKKKRKVNFRRGWKE